MITAEIIAIGTELLLGESQDTNTRTIARAFRELGVNLLQTHIVGDNADHIKEAIVASLLHADVVLTTGGLGPTVDDPTRLAVANALNVGVEFYSELWSHILSRLQFYGRQVGENQKRQAYLPHGAKPVDNPVGTAPAFLVVKGNKVIISLPGVPSEMETILQTSILPFLKDYYHLREYVKVKNLHLAGIGEGAVDKNVGDLEQLENPAVGLVAHPGLVDIRITARASTEREANRMILKVESIIRQRLQDAIFGTDDDTLEAIVVQLLMHKGWMLAINETGTNQALIDGLNKVADGQKILCCLGDKVESSPGTPKERGKEERPVISLTMRLRAAKHGQQLDLTLIAPTTSEHQTLLYGGHPRNGSIWAVNVGLNSLWRVLRD